MHHAKHCTLATRYGVPEKPSVSFAFRILRNMGSGERNSTMAVSVPAAPSTPLTRGLMTHAWLNCGINSVHGRRPERPRRGLERCAESQKRDVATHLYSVRRHSGALRRPMDAPPESSPHPVLHRRCGECRPCLHPAWKQRCERNAAAAAAAGMPPRKRQGSRPAGTSSRGHGAHPFAHHTLVGGDAAAAGGDGAVNAALSSLPPRPKRPKNAFLLFSEQHHRNMRVATPGATFAELADSTGKAWQALGLDERAPWDAAAATALASYDADMAAFKQQWAQLVAAGYVMPTPAATGKQRRRKRSDEDDARSGGDGGESSESDGEPLVATRWEECGPCGRWVVVAEETGTGNTICAECRAPIQLTTGKPLESWVQCDDCGKWRSVSKAAMKALHAAGDDATWTCAMRYSGATCKSGADDWAAVRHRAAREERPNAADAVTGACLRLSDRFVGVVLPIGGAGAATTVTQAAAPEGTESAPGEHGRTRLVLHIVQPSAPATTQSPGSGPAAHGPVGGMHGAPVGGVRPATRCEYIPGRDTLIDAKTLGAGVDAIDGRNGDLVLFTVAVPVSTARLAEPFVTAAIAAYYANRLPDLRDGRESAGPVDVAAFLAEPKHAEAVEAALFRRKQRLAAARQATVVAAQAAGTAPPAAEASRTRHCELNFVIHVKHNQRAVYIGEEGDVTSNGNSIMAFNKSWKGNPIRSWSGGVKVADMPGAQPNKLVQSKLSSLLGDVEPHIVACAEALWAQFVAHSPVTADVARRQVAYLHSGAGGRASTRLGSTGWNAYSFNLDYATAAHYDSKNVTRSFSALLILETGDQPFCGSFYLLPQYRLAMDVRQGCCLFHRSGDPEVGLHANSGLHRPSPATHRVALVFYLTTISDSAVAAAGLGGAATHHSPGAAARSQPAAQVQQVTHPLALAQEQQEQEVPLEDGGWLERAFARDSLGPEAMSLGGDQEAME